MKFIFLFIAVVGFLIGPFLIHNGLPYRVRDLSSEQLFSLNEGSKDVIRRMKNPVTVTYFVPRDLPSLSPQMKFHMLRVERLLRAFWLENPQKVSVKEVNTFDLHGINEEARRAGLVPFKFGPHEVFWGVTFTGKTKRMVTETLKHSAQEFIEYDLVSNLVAMSRDEKPKLYILSTQNVLGEHNDPRFRTAREWSSIRALRRSFEIVQLSEEIESVPRDAAILLVIQPVGLPEEALAAVQSFGDAGGPIFMVADPFPRIFYQSNNRFELEDLSLWDPVLELLESWGIRFLPEFMVGDKLRGAKVQSVGKVIRYPFFLRLTKEDLSSSSKITNRLNHLFFAESGSVQETLGDQFKFTPLVTSSEASGLVHAEEANIKSAMELSEGLKVEKGVNVLAVLVQRKIPQNERMVSVGRNMGRLVFLADIDFLADTSTVEKEEAQETVYLRQKNDNIAFVVNVAEFLGGDQSLMEVKPVEKLFLSLATVRNQRARMVKEFGDKELDLEEDLQIVRSKVDLIKKKHQGAVMADRYKGELQSLREEELLILRKKKNLNEDKLARIRDVGWLIRWLQFVAPLGLLIVIYLLGRPLRKGL